MSGEPLIARIAAGVADFDSADWDRCAGSADPFLSHAFLASVEQWGRAGGHFRWRSTAPTEDRPPSCPLI